MLRKSVVLALVLFTFSAVFIAISAQNASPLVRGGHHDLSQGSLVSGFTYDTKEICVFCHTPHHAATTSVNNGNSYLWNRALQTPSYFKPYKSDTLQAYTVGTWNGPGIFSLLCLSCHDGVGAMNVLLNFNGTLTPQGMYLQNRFGDFNPSTEPGKLNIGGYNSSLGTGGDDLTDDHPIGFSYDVAQGLDSAGLKPFASLPVAISDRLKLTGGSHSVECNTCHDPHMTNDTNPGNKFLVLTGTNLCLGCHIK